MNNKKVIIKTTNGVIDDIVSYNKQEFLDYYPELEENYGKEIANEMIEDEDILFFDKYGDRIRIYTLNKQEALDMFLTLEKILLRIK